MFMVGVFHIVHAANRALACAIAATAFAVHGANVLGGIFFALMFSFRVAACHYKCKGHGGKSKFFYNSVHSKKRFTSIV